jgi:hypothetical protein
VGSDGATTALRMRASAWASTPTTYSK